MKVLGATIDCRRVFVLALAAAALIPAMGFGQGQSREASILTSPLAALLPKAADWKPAENPQQYLPDTLFEYIDGAAESYLGYDFRELVVAQYKCQSVPAGSLTVEVYDMGNARQAFGIYSAERYPETRFLAAGVQGYYEDGSLNFLVGRYYVKLMCYDCGPAAEKMLTTVAGDISSRVGDKGGFPSILSSFPRSGLVPNSEKYILRNFQGLSFLRNGYQASYKIEGREFECFIVDAQGELQAEAALKQYLDNYRRAGLEVKAADPGSTFKDKYLLNVFVARVGPYLCGVTRVADGQEAEGRTTLGLLAKSLAAARRP
jgi:hypothetical protein